MIPGTTPADPRDTGAADPALVSALAAGDADAVRSVLLSVRLLMPVMAEGADAAADLAVPALVAADGRRALPVFSCYDALRAWRPDARPVPMPGARLLAGAAAEGYDGVVLDVAGPVPHTIQRDDLLVLAAAAAALQASGDVAGVAVVPPG